MTDDSTKDETSVSSAGKKTAMASRVAEGSSSNEETASTEVFTRRFYILAVFSIFTMEQVMWDKWYQNPYLYRGTPAMVCRFF